MCVISMVLISSGLIYNVKNKQKKKETGKECEGNGIGYWFVYRETGNHFKLLKAR